ncbi:MAG: hypothetical protein IKF75_01835 [Lachnospiraceae bacterium]|nr:hypothetical protein [Lachnospiraceae bacterium]
MPTDDKRIEPLYLIDAEAGERWEFAHGGVIQLSTDPDETEDDYDWDRPFEGEIVIPIRPRKIHKRKWIQDVLWALGVPKYLINEWRFPRKKRRGTKRRNRRRMRNDETNRV